MAGIESFLFKKSGHSLLHALDILNYFQPSEFVDMGTKKPQPFQMCTHPHLPGSLSFRDGASTAINRKDPNGFQIGSREVHYPH